jgi:ribonuclease HI
VSHVWDRHFTVSTGDGKDDTSLPGIRCYTVGSKLSRSGSGYSIYRQGTDEPILGGNECVGEATVFQAEVHVIKMACIAAKSLPDIRATIFCDSQAAILAIHKTCIQSCTVQRTVKALHLLGHRKIVHLQWIKAHIGSVGNDRANTLAKEGTQIPRHGPRTFPSNARCSDQGDRGRNNSP